MKFETELEIARSNLAGATVAYNEALSAEDAAFDNARRRRTEDNILEAMTTTAVIAACNAKTAAKAAYDAALATLARRNNETD